MKKLMMGLVVAGVVGMLSVPAEAGVIQVTITSSSCSAACPPLVLLGGANTFTTGGSIAFGDVNIAINGQSNNPGSSIASFLQQNTITISQTSPSASAEDLTVQISQTDFNLPIGPSVLGTSLSGTGVSTPGTSTVSLLSGYGSGVNNTYGNYTTTAPLVLCNFAGAPSPACSQNSSVGLVSAAPFSLSNIFTIHLAAGLSTVNVTGTTALVSVPDGGATLSLLGMAMAGLGFVARRRK